MVLMKSFYELEEYALVKDVPIMQKEGIEYLIEADWRIFCFYRHHRILHNQNAVVIFYENENLLLQTGIAVYIYKNCFVIFALAGIFVALNLFSC